MTRAQNWTTTAGRRCCTNLDRLHDAAAERGIRAVLHPHVGTMIENKDEVTRVLDGSTIPLCLDTGHLLIGGTNPVELVGAAADRITHTHLKDVHADYAARVQSGELTYTQAVAQGMYTPLGTGDADIAGVVTNLLDQGFEGWFTLEQDTILRASPRAKDPSQTCAPASTTCAALYRERPADRGAGRLAHRRGGHRLPRRSTGSPSRRRGGP